VYKKRSLESSETPLLYKGRTVHKGVRPNRWVFPDVSKDYSHFKIWTDRP